MKVKALRHKETKEFIHIMIRDGYNSFDIFTSNNPEVQPETATIEAMSKYYRDWGCEVDFEPYELVEFELVEKNTIGADIRNKLSPPKNLVALLEEFFSAKVGYTEERREFVELIKKEMEQTKVSVEYLANLL